MENGLEKLWNLPSELPYRERVEEFERMFLSGNLGGVKYEKSEIEIQNDGENVLYPSCSKYNHYFSSGLYVREMFVEGGIFGFTGIHNLANPLFVMKGTMWCTSESGVQKLVAPTFVLTEPGTKRICWFPEDSIVVTVHPNPDGITDLDEIEKKFFSTKWDQYGDNVKEGKDKLDWQLFEHKEYYKKIENEKNK